MANNEFSMILWFIVFGALVIGSIFWANSRSRQIIEGWAEMNGFQLVASEQRYLWRGPFFWSTSRNQTVYYVTVMTPDGRTRHAWARCGSWWVGVLFSDEIDVQWDD